MFNDIAFNEARFNDATSGKNKINQEGWDRRGEVSHIRTDGDLNNKSDNESQPSS